MEDRRTSAPLRNFYEQFAAAARRFPGRTAIDVQRRGGLESYTYAELQSATERVAAWLTAAGLGQGDRCSIFAENDATWCAAYLGILRVGGVAVPFDTAYKPAQLATLLADSGARILFTSPRHLDDAREGATLAGAGSVAVELLPGVAEAETPHATSAAGSPAAALAPCPALESDIAVILYTSGTTADPKGVMLTHANLLAEREAAFRVVAATERDCILGVLPLFHALAQMANLLLPLSIGARVVFLESVNTTELLKALRERGVTLFACVPQFYYLIHQRVMQEVARSGIAKRAVFKALLAANGLLRRSGLNAGRVLFGRVHQAVGGHMRLMVTGGSRFDPAVGRDLYNLGFDILQAYGLTETSGAATLMRPGDRRFDTVGPPLPGVELRILRAEGGSGQHQADASGTDSEPSDGEVLVGGPVVMAGYFNRPDATAAVLRNGWLHTGDLGRIDAAGRLSITGRLKELIVLGSGKNIYPEEIEGHYRQSAVIGELCVLGMARPGEPSAERLYAVVVPDPDVLKERRIVNVGELVRFEMESLSAGLPSHKRVLGYEIWREALPRTTTGKLKRFEIERRIRAAQAGREAAPGSSGDSDAERQWAREEDVAPVLAAIQSAVPGRRVTADANLELDLGLDSMERVELLTALEGRFGTRVPEEVTQETHTVRDLVNAILAYRGSTIAESAEGAWDSLLGPAEGPDPGLTSFNPLTQSRPVATVVLFGVLQMLLAVFRLVVRIEASGREHVPSKGPYIISPNHQSYLDPFVVVGVLPFHVVRQLFFVGASEYFEGPLLRWLAAKCNVVPVDPDSALVSAMQASAYGLRRGKVLVLFPEGERSIDGTVRTFKKGAAILAHHVGVPIVPVAIDGLFDMWPRTRPVNWRILRPWKRPVVRVRFGEPLAAQAPAAAGTGAPGSLGWGRPSGQPSSIPPEAYAQTTARLRSAVDVMWSGIHRAPAAGSLDRS